MASQILLACVEGRWSSGLSAWAWGFLELCPGGWAWSQAGPRVLLRAFSSLPPLQNLPSMGGHCLYSAVHQQWSLDRLGMWGYMAMWGSFGHEGCHSPRARQCHGLERMG